MRLLVLACVSAAVAVAAFLWPRNAAEPWATGARARVTTTAVGGAAGERRPAQAPSSPPDERAVQADPGRSSVTMPAPAITGVAAKDRSPELALRPRPSDVSVAPRRGHPTSVAKARAAAVASNLASQEQQDTVSPLARLYFAAFGRFPDYEGLDYYTAQRYDGAGLAAIAEEFAGSREFDLRYGTLDDAAFVDQLSRNAGGAGEAARRAHWIAQLESGAMTRGEVMVAISESAGFRARSANEVFVAMAYAEALRRTPDPEGFARWVAFLDAGNPRQAVIDGLMASASR